MSWDEIAAIIPFFGLAVALGAMVGAVTKTAAKLLDKI